jgi:hypothetical protein
MMPEEMKVAGPNWRYAAKIYILVLQNPKATDEAIIMAEEDLMKMAGLADKYNELKKES